MPTPPPNRREFLQVAAATALVPLMQTGSSMAATPSTKQPWKWAPEPGLWETACGDDIVAQLHAAADAGFAAFADPQLLDRSSNERDALLMAARQRGVTLGPARNSAHPLTWTIENYFEVQRCGTTGWRSEIDASPRRLSDVESASGRQRVIQSLRKYLAIIQEQLSARSPAVPLVPKLVEPWTADVADRRWYDHFADIVHDVNHPQCRLSVDTYRLAAAGIDVVDYMHRHAAILGHVELADYPGGFEPGSGTLDIAGIVAATALSPHDGVIGLRCGLSQPGPAGLSRLIAAAHEHHGLCEDGWA